MEAATPERLKDLVRMLVERVTMAQRGVALIEIVPAARPFFNLLPGRRSAGRGRGEELGDPHHGDRPDEGEPFTIDLVASSRRPVVAREESKLSPECGIDQRLPVDALVGDDVGPKAKLKPEDRLAEGRADRRTDDRCRLAAEVRQDRVASLPGESIERERARWSVEGRADITSPSETCL
jgi:hypothetical protein